MCIVLYVCYSVWQYTCVLYCVYGILAIVVPYHAAVVLGAQSVYVTSLLYCLFYVWIVFYVSCGLLAVSFSNIRLLLSNSPDIQNKICCSKNLVYEILRYHYNEAPNNAILLIQETCQRKSLYAGFKLGILSLTVQLHYSWIKRVGYINGLAHTYAFLHSWRWIVAHLFF